MNNEFYNNDNKDQSLNPNGSTDQNISQSKQTSDYSYFSNNYNPYSNASQPYTEGYSYTGFTETQATEKKPKKKRKLFGALKLTAAGLAFGLVAGASFQAFIVATQPVVDSGDTAQESSQANIKITQSTASSKDTVVPAGNSADTIVTDVSDVVEKVMPSIVAINSSATVTSYDFFGREYDEPMQGSGSGIIIAQNGTEILIATNNHVIEGAEEVEIVFVNEKTAKASVKGSDAKADLAVLSVDLTNVSEDTVNAIKVATLGNSDETKPGEMAIAIGNALGYGQSVTVGYISAVNREVTIEDQVMTLIQTDAAINPGNSGGALINSSGNVIGINSVKFASAEVEGMGYAIPISKALPIINDLMKREVVAEGEQGFLGIDASTAQDVTELYSQRFNMPIGVYINDVISESPAEEAGLMQGDIITGIDTTKIETIEDLISALQYKKAGQTIDLIIQVKENGKYVEKTLKVTLGERQQ